MCVTRAFRTHLRHERRRVVKSLGRDDLARPQDRQLVGERLTARRPVILGSGEFAGRQIEERDADAPRWRRSGAIAMRNAGSRASR